MNSIYTLLEKIRSTVLQERYILLMVFFTILIIPFRIFSFNYWPPDDANRHIAKVISGKSWPEILVMDTQFQSLDHNEGWHFILGTVHRLGANSETLMLFSCIRLFLLLTMSGLFLFRKQPMVWVGALLIAPYVADTNRWMFGRPFMVSESILLLLLGIWHREWSNLRTRWFTSLVLFALAGWIHGAWYLMILVPVSFALAGKMKTALQVALAWISGSICAGILNGHPIEFLIKQFTQTLSSVDSATVTRLLVGEFHPQMGIFPILFLVILFVIVRLYKLPTEQLKHNPGLWLAVIGWILSMVNGRFWWDWGSVGYMYLMAETLILLLKQKEIECSSRNLCHVCMACAALFLVYTTDIKSRWSNNDFRDRLSLEDPAHTEWLPESGGILYSDTMKAYYETFYNNPHGEWRYILGHEPALMPADDLKIYREIQFYNHTIDSLFSPWVDKMRPEDRLIVYRGKSSEPDIPGLEWKYIAYNTWSGRVPKEMTP